MFASPAINKQSHFFQLTGTQTITIGYLMKMNTNAEYFKIIMGKKCILLWFAISCWSLDVFVIRFTDNSVFVVCFFAFWWQRVNFY